jgi:hypothetical protein
VCGRHTPPRPVRDATREQRERENPPRYDMPRDRGWQRGRENPPRYGAPRDRG